MDAVYPLEFRPILMSKVWGGDRLARFGKAVSPGANVGESWEVADLDTTSAGGAGGGAQRSVVANGPHAGRTLREMMDLWGGRLLGSAARWHGGGFPLLVKFLDARENLSVQVHPSPGYAASHPGAHLKTECWYILDAEPGSVIYKGVRPGVTRASFAASIERGTVVDDLVAVPAVVGECHNLPSGTCHALGAGVLVAEVQTPSDTTYRVYDWGRTGRELHVAQSLECISWGPAPSAVRLRNPAGGRGDVLRTEFFEVSHLSLSPEAEGDVSRRGACTIVMVLGGGGSLYHEGGAFAPVPLRAGITLLVPAPVSADATLAAGDATRVEALIAELPG